MNPSERREAGLPPRAKDLRGQQFERLRVLYVGAKDKHRNTQWMCVCDCGNTTLVRAADLNSGKVRSCGCLRSESQQNLKRAAFRD